MNNGTNSRTRYITFVIIFWMILTSILAVLYLLVTANTGRTATTGEIVVALATTLFIALIMGINIKKGDR